MGAEMFHADGKIAMTNITVVFRNSANATENSESFAQCIYVPRGLLPEEQ
jgi:hypothetical protein